MKIIRKRDLLMEHVTPRMVRDIPPPRSLVEDIAKRMALGELRKRVCSHLQTGDTDEVKWLNQGLVTALNCISDMEAGNANNL